MAAVGRAWRLRRDYDAAATGGYRDIQLSCRLVSAEAKARGVEHHIAEAAERERELRAKRRQGLSHVVPREGRSGGGAACEVQLHLAAMLALRTRPGGGA